MGIVFEVWEGVLSENTKKGCRDILRGEPLHVKTTLKQRVGIEVCISKVHAVLVGVLSGEVWVLISRASSPGGGLILGEPPELQQRF